MDGERSSSRLRDRLARMFRPGTLLRSTCNTSSAATKPAASSAYGCSSSRALLAADAGVDSFLASSRRDYSGAAVARTESFSTAVDRIHRRGGAAVSPAPPPSRFSVEQQYAPPPLLPPGIGSNKQEKKKSPRDDRRVVVSRNDKKQMKLLSNDPYGFSSSEDDVFSSSEAEDLAAKKLSAGGNTARSFSSDSSEFYTTAANSKKKKKIKQSSPAAPRPTTPSAKPPLPPASRKKHRRAASSCDTCGVRDGFRPVVSASEEQLRRGFAVVKRSRDPYADFRSSMVEMIVGRQLFGAPELERLLRSYLSLNAPRHHPVILQAFSDIWVVLHHAG
jgi:uncharacterized protein (TIGR01568 family)